MARLKLPGCKSFVLDFGPLGRTAGVRKRTTMNLRKKTHPTTRLIEAMLDLALLAGFISAMGFLVRLAF
jgi:hypothetical protein